MGNVIRMELGRIQSVSVGMGGYQEACFGVSFTLGGKGWGVGDFWGAWAPGVVDPGDRSKWTEADRSAELVKAMSRLSKLLTDAKKSKVSDLQGMPVEVTFDGNMLESWRLLTEVLP